jgi:hypothetical protein
VLLSATYNGQNLVRDPLRPRNVSDTDSNGVLGGIQEHSRYALPSNVVNVVSGVVANGDSRDPEGYIIVQTSSDMQVFKLLLGTIGINGTVSRIQFENSVVVHNAVVSPVAPLIVGREAYWLLNTSPVTMINVDLNTMASTSNTFPSDYSAATNAVVLVTNTSALYGMQTSSGASVIVRVDLTSMSIDAAVSITISTDTVQNFCCASATLLDAFSIWVSSTGTVYRLDRTDMSIQNTLNLTSTCPAPTSLISTNYYIYLGCTNGNTIKIRKFDLSVPDVLDNSNLAVTSLVHDGTYSYISYVGTTEVAILQLHGSNITTYTDYSTVRTLGRVGLEEQETKTLDSVGLFQFVDGRYAYYYGQNNHLYKYSMVLPPRTTLLIEDDGDSGTIQFSDPLFDIKEQNGANTSGAVKITRTGRDNPSGTMVVSYVTTGMTAEPWLDFVPVESSMEFAASFEGSFNLDIIHDNIYEYPDETFNVELTKVHYSGVEINNLGPQNNAIVKILDDGDSGTLSFSSLTFYHPESSDPSEQNVTITVTRDGRGLTPDGNISVSYKTIDSTAISTGSADANGTQDYVPALGELYFNTHEITKTFQVQILQDDYYEYPNENVTLLLYDIKYQAVANGDYDSVYSLQIEQNVSDLILVDDGGKCGFFVVVVVSFCICCICSCCADV